MGQTVSELDTRIVQGKRDRKWQRERRSEIEWVSDGEEERKGNEGRKKGRVGLSKKERAKGRTYWGTAQALDHIWKELWILQQSLHRASNAKATKYVCVRVSVCASLLVCVWAIEIVIFLIYFNLWDFYMRTFVAATL